MGRPEPGEGRGSGIGPDGQRSGGDRGSRYRSGDRPSYPRGANRAAAAPVEVVRVGAVLESCAPQRWWQPWRRWWGRRSGRLMILRLAKRKGGIAMVIVLVVIAALVVIATGFAFSMGVETRLVRNTRFNPDLDWLGRSGVELARYILSKPVPNEERMDALHRRWAGGPGRAPRNRG